MSKEVYTNLSNYYGTVYGFEDDGKYYLALDNYDNTQTIEISEEFFKAFCKEFKGE